jgi:8-oxo-dGTP diphosphatase
MAPRSRKSPPGYDPHAFPPVAVTVDIVVLTLEHQKLSVLLIERGEKPYRGTWALPGGFIREDETLDAAAARELREETGVLAAGYLQQLGAYGDPNRDPRMRVVTVAYIAMLRDVGPIAASTDATRAKVFPVDALLRPRPSRTLAFDHKQILADAVHHARKAIASTSLATEFLGPEFTISELRAGYEAVLGRPLDPGNFRRKVLATKGLLVPTGKRVTPTEAGGKPAEVYRAKNAKMIIPLEPSLASMRKP